MMTDITYIFKNTNILSKNLLEVIDIKIYQQF